MKKNHFGVLLVAIIIVGFTSCNSSPNKRIEQAEKAVISADDNLQEAQSKLQQARIDSMEYAEYLKLQDAKLLDNELKIATLKSEMKKKRKEIQKKYNEELDDLERGNLRLKNRMLQFKDNTKDKVDTFKLHFNQDIDKLGKSISDMAERNMKK